MDHAECRTHTPTLVEIIEFQAPARSLDPAQIASLYTDKELTTSQVAKQLGCSKSYVVTSLKRRGLLRHKSISKINPNNYRSSMAPYGYRVVAGRLAPHAAEMKICRLVVELMDRRGMNQIQVVEHLSKKGFKNRGGKTTWHNQTVSRIYTRWKGKL